MDTGSLKIYLTTVRLALAILLSKALVKEALALKEVSGGTRISGVRYANFIQDKFAYINITPVRKRLVERSIQCALSCLDTLPCFSFNLAALQDNNDKLLCEHLPSDKYNNSDQFVVSKDFHHFSILSPCSSSPCNGNGKCVALYAENSYLCICKTGFIGQNCENDVDECSLGKQNCSTKAVCTNTEGSYNCTCKEGYNGDGRNCSDIDECSSENNCHVNANCTNTIGSYNCTCEKGYGGDGRNCSGKDCLDIKTSGLSRGDGIYLLNPDGGSPSNAFQAYCDMTSYNGGWTMCYTTDEYAKPRMEVTYNAKTPYGSDGYRTDCNNIPFTEIMFVDHQTGKKAYFKRKSNLSVKAAAQYGKTGSALGLWDAVGASAAYSYQLLICDISFYTGFFVSGFTGNCYKQCHHWCGDGSSPYFRTASTHSGYKGVAFNANGHRSVSPRLMSVGLR